MVRFMALAGTLIAAYLWWARSDRAAHPGCMAGGDCSYIWFSRWATWFGVPVSALALIPYGLVFWNTFLARQKLLAEGARMLLAFLAVFLLLMAGWFVALQGLVIKQWCLWCCLSHGTSVLTAISVFCWLRVDGVQPLQGSWLRGRSCFAGLVAGLVAIASHAISSRSGDEYVFMPMPNVKVVEHVDATTIRVFGRPVNVRSETLPYHGSAESAEVLVTLFDYTCPDCRRLHGQMRHVTATFPGRFQELLLPAPLNTECNPTVTLDSSMHVGGCQLAKLACVVAKYQPEAFPAFHDWLMEGPTPPSLEMALTKARSIVADVDIAKAMEDPACLGPLQTGVRAFQDNKEWNRLEGLPLCLMKDGSFMGAPGDIDPLATFLRKLAQPMH